VKASGQAEERACVWWDPAIDSWSSSGCVVSNTSSATETVCLCSHLTNFGIIFDYTGQADADDRALNILTYVLLTLSSMAILATQLLLHLLK
jgi:hypothetical protein